jgi:hypothetical protein
MAPRRQAQAITPPPAGVHTGALVLAFVGTNPTDRTKAIGSKRWPGVSASGRCTFRTFRSMEKATDISTKTLMRKIRERAARLLETVVSRRSA